ncbi:hypothetical protein CsatA_003009 [Cannabis sativa]
MSSSSGVGGSRVSIPTNVKKTINDIREITGKQHSDDEIYAVLRECSMDPNETAQRLLYLDTFHEVKSRRERKKDVNFNTRGSEERSPTGVQRRVKGSVQGNYGSNFSSDVGGGRNGGRRENGNTHFTDRGPMSPTVPYSQRMKNNAPSRVTKAVTGLPNGTANMPNGVSSADANKLEPAAPPPAVASSPPTVASLVDEQGKSTTSDSPSAPDSGDSCVVSIVENDVGSKQLAAEPKEEINVNNTVLGNNNLELSDSVSEEVVQGAADSKLNEKSCEPSENETVCVTEPSEPPLSVIQEVITTENSSTVVEGSSQSESNVTEFQHVTFPSNFEVPEALKNGLTFGSFDTKVESVSEGVENMGLTKSSQDTDETYKERSSSVPSDYLENSESLPQVLEKLQPLSEGTDLKGKQLKQETVTQLPLNGAQFPVVINAPNYGVGLMPPMLGGHHLVRLEGHEVQAHENRSPNFANGNSVTSSTATSVAPVPSSMAMTPQPLPVFRHAYPSNFYPYHCIPPPYYVPNMHHQYLSQNGFPSSNGNIFLPPPPPLTAAGVKYAVSQYKSPNNGGNPTHLGMQPTSSYLTAPVGYAQPIVSASLMGNEDPAASHLKENQIYTTGQPSEASGYWIHPTGQEMPGLQMNSMYNISPQHIAYAAPQQSAHAAYAGIFPPPGHAMTAPSTLLQHSQAVTGATIENAGPPNGTYQQPPQQQQPQHPQQMNWNASF